MRNTIHICCKHFIVLASLSFSLTSFGQKVDYSVVTTDEESGSEFVKVSKESDYVCLPTVKRTRTGVQWLTNRILDIHPQGNELAFLSLRNGTTNIFVKDINRQGAARQRTNRNSILDFAYSPDGKSITFSEKSGKTNMQFITDAFKGFTCRQITSGQLDYSPIYSNDMKTIFFCRQETRGMSIWGYDVSQNFLTNFTNGLNPYPSKNKNILYISRSNNNGHGEIWKIDITNGIEECVVSDIERSFYAPQLSPDESKILFVGSSKISISPNVYYWNTDIYVCNTDGTELQQMTYHAADDLSPVWSIDGNYIYFISQRGSAEGYANIWRMTYNK